MWAIFRTRTITLLFDYCQLSVAAFVFFDVVEDLCIIYEGQFVFARFVWNNYGVLFSVTFHIQYLVGVFMNTTFVPKILYKLLLLRFEVDFELVSQLRM